MPDDMREQAERFAALFRALYLTYHRRDGPRSDLSGASRAVLAHLAVAGPLTGGEAATHLGRAQSVVSEIVDGLERKGLLERERDPTDRRRTLVWLTSAGQDTLRRDGEVLAVDTIAAALARMPAEARRGLLAGAAELLAAAPSQQGHPAATEPQQDDIAVTHPAVTHPAVTHPAATHPAATHHRRDTP